MLFVVITEGIRSYKGDHSNITKFISNFVNVQVRVLQLSASARIGQFDSTGVTPRRHRKLTWLFTGLYHHILYHLRINPESVCTTYTFRIRGIKHYTLIFITVIVSCDTLYSNSQTLLYSSSLIVRTSYRPRLNITTVSISRRSPS